MIKSIIVSLNLLLLLLFGYVAGEKVKVSQQGPESMVEPKSSFEITVSISKGSVIGFGKYDVKLPAGTSAEEVNSNGATFTFSDGMAKFIWLELPTDEMLSFTYRVTLGEESPNSFKIGGKFSYLENNNRLTASANDVQIKVNKSAAEAQKAIEEKEAVDVEVIRNIIPLGEEKFKVELEIKKQGISGFAKIEERLPRGSKAYVETDNMNSVFSFVGSKAKIAWVNLPADKRMKVYYIADLKNATEADLNLIDGDFAFLVDDETRKISIINAKEADTKTQLASKETPKETETTKETPKEAEKPSKQVAPVTAEKPAKEEQKAKESKEAKPKKQTPVKAETETATTQNDPLTIPSPQSGLIYRVQIAAGHKQVQKEYFEKTYKYSDEYLTENHEGWIKYTTGAFETYKEARDKRENLNSFPFPGPFVTAYNSGQRITVQEALMISNQKWVK
jgi:hypothetical protein